MVKVHRPDHESHLKAKYNRIVSVIRQDKLKAITISNGTKSSSPKVPTKFVEHPVEAKAFAKVGMEVFFLATTTSSNEGDRAKATFRVFLHELAFASCHLAAHGSE